MINMKKISAIRFCKSFKEIVTDQFKIVTVDDVFLHVTISANNEGLINITVLNFMISRKYLYRLANFLLQ